MEPVGTVCLSSYGGNKSAMKNQGQPVEATCWPSRAISQGLRTRPWAIKEKHNERVPKANHARTLRNVRTESGRHAVVTAAF